MLFFRLRADNLSERAPGLRAAHAFCVGANISCVANAKSGVGSGKIVVAIEKNFVAILNCDEENVNRDANAADSDAEKRKKDAVFGARQERIRAMPDDFLPRKKGDLASWTNNYVTVVTANVTLIGFTPADMTALTAAQTAYSSALASVEAAKAALKSAVQAEKTAMKSLTSVARGGARRIQANPGVTPALKGQMGLNPGTTVKNHTPPATPTNVMVEGFSSGVNRLKWKRAGNKPNTIFEVQARIGASVDFVGVGSASATKFEHTGQAPGVKVAYRIVATRVGKSSVPSVPVTVYDSGAAPTLTLTKAA